MADDKRTTGQNFFGQVLSVDRVFLTWFWDKSATIVGIE